MTDVKDEAMSEHEDAMAEQMPFRPYKVPVTEILSGEEVIRRIQCASFMAGFDEQGLREMGGKQAVLVSIRRHMPEFDPAQALYENAPAWSRLKPVLVRCGLIPGDETTLTDIKCFLDATTLPTDAAILPRVDERNRAMPDPKRVFVIYGRNIDAYQEMRKFLLALRLDPKGFYDLSAECGPNIDGTQYRQAWDGPGGWRRCLVHSR